VSKEDRRDVGRFLFLIDAYLKTLMTTKGRMLLDRVARLGHCIPKTLQASSICILINWEVPGSATTGFFISLLS